MFRALLIILGITNSIGDPKVDISKPIRNDQLIQKLADFKQAKLSKEEIYKEIKKANLLLAVLADSIETKPKTGGRTTIQVGSKIIPLPYEMANGQRMASIFTDWDEIKKYSNQSVSTFVLKSDDIEYMSKDGLCLNPATDKIVIISGKVQ